MADGRNYRDRACGHSPGDDFLIERPQILNRAAASADNQNIGKRPGVKEFDRGGYLRRGSGALNLYGAENDLRNRKAA